jgi:hypothetical protein
MTDEPCGCFPLQRAAPPLPLPGYQESTSEDTEVARFSVMCVCVYRCVYVGLCVIMIEEFITYYFVPQ